MGSGGVGEREREREVKDKGQECVFLFRLESHVQHLSHRCACVNELPDSYLIGIILILLCVCVCFSCPFLPQLGLFKMQPLADHPVVCFCLTVLLGF